MGVGAAMILPATLSVLANVFTEAWERRRAIAYWSLMNAAGTTIGPITGGLLLRHYWWGSVFLVNVPVVALALLVGWKLVPDSRNARAGPPRRGRCRAVHRRAVGAPLRDHHGGFARLDRPLGGGGLRHHRGRAGGLRGVGAADAGADAQPALLP